MNRDATLTVAAALGAMWVAQRRDFYRRGSVPLPDDARRVLERFFSADFLQRTEVAGVDVVAAPLAGIFPGFSPRGMLDLSTVRGMALIDTVVLASANVHQGEDTVSLLFHELVHIMQYHILGTRAFIHRYLAGWLDAGRSYLDNPLERMAFELQQRFEGGRALGFAVESEVHLALGRM